MGETVSGRVAHLGVTEHLGGWHSWVSPNVCVPVSTFIPYIVIWLFFECFGHNILIIVSQLLNSVAIHNKILKRSGVILWDL